jgi:hypothetical protein
MYQRVYAELVRAAEYRGLTTYQQLAVIMDLPLSGNLMGKRIGQILGEIVDDEIVAGRPMLSAVVVGTNSLPGAGFYSYAREKGRLAEGQSEADFWATEREAVYEAWRRPLRASGASSVADGASHAPPTSQGADDFLSSIDVSPEANRPLLRELADWALGLHEAGLARLSTTNGKDRTMLKVCVLGEDAGLATICNEHGRGTIWLWRRVFERRAPKSIKSVEAAAGIELGDGRIPLTIDDALLEALHEAYRETLQVG